MTALRDAAIAAWSSGDSRFAPLLPAFLRGGGFFFAMLGWCRTAATAPSSSRPPTAAMVSFAFLLLCTHSWSALAASARRSAWSSVAKHGAGKVGGVGRGI